jgi:uncharacterized membrane-anchored protein YhcB (DUF1043 family)
MNKEKLRLIIQNLESLIECLKSEIDSDKDTIDHKYKEIVSHLNDYDEVFYDDENDYPN